MTQWMAAAPGALQSGHAQHWLQCAPDIDSSVTVFDGLSIVVMSLCSCIGFKSVIQEQWSSFDCSCITDLGFVHNHCDSG